MKAATEVLGHLQLRSCHVFPLALCNFSPAYGKTGVQVYI